MIELTPVAAERVAALRSGPERQVLRLFVTGRSCCGYAYGLALDEDSAPEDAVAESLGIRVAVDPESLQYVRGSTIDYVEDPAGSGFVVRNPNVAGSCACANG